MRTALESLNAGKNALAKAEHNKGGWRDLAVQHAPQAYDATAQVCGYANGH